MAFDSTAFVAATALAGVVIVVAAALSGVVERIRVPLVALFLVLGTIIGPHALGLADFPLNSAALGAIATLGLVLVLFTDAVTLDMSEVRRHALLSTLILGPATLLTTAAVGAAGYWLLGLPVAAAAIVGAALASTDPVMMRSLLRTPGVPPTARIALGIESGLNDAVLLPVIVVAAAVAGGTHGQGHAGVSVLTDVLFKGPLAGVVIGFLAVRLLEYVRRKFGMRRDYESLYVLGVAFTAYAAAEAIGGSGFMAAFTAGAVIAAIDVELCDCFHEYGEATAEMLLLFCFVAFGTSLIWTGLAVLEWRTLAFAAVALFARTAVLAVALLPLRMERMSRGLIVWYGPRALSSLLLVMVAVFAGVPASGQLFALVSLVVLLSVVLHGALLAVFARHLRGEQADEAATVLPATAAAADDVRMTVEEVARLQREREPVVVVDARAAGAWNTATTAASGSVRVEPDSAVESAAAQALPRNAWLVAYCA
jgi:NhaP-type Na+/H+ or K+/H+ antiporter